MIRVLLIDDSAVFVDAVTMALERDPDLRVCGSASSAHDLVAIIEALRPDVVTVDLHMPGIDGLEAVSRVMAARPVPILVMTADPRGYDGSLCMKAFARGAVDVVEKPDLTDETKRRRLCERLKAAAGARPAASSAVVVDLPRTRTVAAAADVVVGIVASTGGPAALATVLSGLPADVPAAILVVQHLADGFVSHFAGWLNDVCRLKVRVAVDGELASPGLVLIAPDHGHLSLRSDGRVVVDTRAEAIDGHRPSGTALLSSMARVRARQHVGVILSGMGRDGVDGLHELRAAGGGSCAQDGASSVVDGMPKAARDGGVSTVLPAQKIAGWLVAEVSGRSRSARR